MNKFYKTVALLILVSFPITVFAKTANDEYFLYQDYLDQISAEEAWDISTGSKDVIVAVLDTGVDLNHPDLVDHIWTNAAELPDDGKDNDGNGFVDDVHGWDFVDLDNDPSPSYEFDGSERATIHGTLIAGIIGAMSDNSKGITGINWDVSIMPLRIMDKFGAGFTDDAARAIDYAVQQGVDVINLSFSGVAFDSSLQDSLKRAYRSGVVVVAAAGNNDNGGENLDEQKMYPICHGSSDEDWVLGVAAVTKYDRKLSDSNYGRQCVDISAPGENIFSTKPYVPNIAVFSDPYGGFYSGTSMAAPQVSAAAALLKAKYPSLTPMLIQLVLKLSVDPLQTSNNAYRGRMGTGRLNIAKALTIASNYAEESLVNRSESRNPTGRIILSSPGGQIPKVRSFSEENVPVSEWLAYNKGFLGGVNVAVGDVNGDGVDEVITGAGSGGGPHVRVFTQDGVLLGQFFAYDSGFRGGVNLAVADINNDGKEEIITAPGVGDQSAIRFFSLSGERIGTIIPFGPGFRLGIRIGSGDIDGDGKAEILASQGPGGTPVVKVLETNGEIKQTFDAYNPSFNGGVFVDAGDIDGDGKAEIVTGVDVGGGPQVRLFDEFGNVEGQFFAYDSDSRLGVRVSVGDRNADGVSEIVTSEGSGGSSLIKIFDRHGNVQTSWTALWSGANMGIW